MKLNIKVREIMKGKLYETLIGTDARLAITISGEELKTLLLVCDTTLWKWAKRGKLVPQKVGARNIYREADVLAVLRGEK